MHIKIPAVVILISVLIFSGADKLGAQEKLTMETTVLPSGFRSADPIVLSENIQAILNQNKPSGKTAEEILRGKAIYNNLTTDDLFAIELTPYRSILAERQDLGLRFRAELFPFRSLTGFPSPRPIYSGELGIGTGYLPINSILAGLNETSAEKVSETFWTTNYLPIATIYPKEALAKKYIGTKADCVKISPTGLLTCNGRDFSVPSPQIHYGFSFVKKQEFPLVKTYEELLSLETYKISIQDESGIVAWVQNNNEGVYAPIFIVKLAAPYMETKRFEMRDPVEKKPHVAVRNLLYVNLVGLWIYNQKTGQIVSKNGNVPDYTQNGNVPDISQNSNTVNAPNSLVSRLRIIKKPRPEYTEEARQNQVQGQVQLKVTFLANGKIGEITAVSGLPLGLTEQCYKVARGIEFEPEKVNGNPVTVSRVITCNFSIY